MTTTYKGFEIKIFQNKADGSNWYSGYAYENGNVLLSCFEYGKTGALTKIKIKIDLYIENPNMTKDDLNLKAFEIYKSL